MGRLPWDQLPVAIRSWVQDMLGGTVVAASSQPGGFSPGAACRLVLADGGRAFLKAVSAAANPESPDLHRQEARIAAALPAGVPAPAFLGSFDSDGWVALLFADVDGRQPGRPWRLAELSRVIRSLDRLHELLTPSPLTDLPTLQDAHRQSMCGWRKLASARVPGDRPLDGPLGSPLDRLDAWSRRNLPALADLEAGWEAAAAGNTLLHSDVRDDNVLITDDDVVFVDWPWACTGAPWWDVAAFAPSVPVQGGPEPGWVLARSSSAAAADPDAVTAVVAAIAGYLTRQALQPPPPGLPTLRAFQAAQGAHARGWLRDRTGLA